MDERDTFDMVLKQHTEDEIKRYEDLKNDIKELQTSVQALTDAWQQAKGVVSFIKWILGISGGLTVFFTFMKDHWK